MDILLLRHAHAGSKAQWKDNDSKRPLSHRGRREAAALLPVLREYGITRIASSPYLRCVQTVAPLAEERFISVTPVEQLGPGQNRTLDWMRNIEGSEVWLVCTHGETIGPILTALELEDGVQLGPYPTWEKASTWVLSRRGRTFVDATFRPAPDLDS